MQKLKQVASVTVAAFAVFAQVVSAALYTDASQLPTLKYDFVIIGGTSEVLHTTTGTDVLMIVCSWHGGERYRYETH